MAIEFYSGCESEDLYEFSTDLAVNPFGVELLRLTESIYDDVDEAIEELAVGLQQRGIEADEDTVYGFMSGELLPTQECLEAFADLCVDEEGGLDVDAFRRLVNSAEYSAEVANEMLELLEEEEDYEDDEYEEDEYYEDEDDGEYYYEDDEDPRVEELQSQLDDITTREVQREDLESLVQYGKQLQGEGVLPPIAFSLLFGQEDSTTNSRYMEFSQACESSEVPNELQLDRIEYCLNVFEQCGPLMDFSQYSEPETEFDVNPQLDTIVDGTLDAYYD